MSEHITDPAYKAAHSILDHSPYLSILAHLIPDYLEQDYQQNKDEQYTLLIAAGVKMVEMMLTHQEDLFPSQLCFLDKLLELVDLIPDEVIDTVADEVDSVMDIELIEGDDLEVSEEEDKVIEEEEDQMNVAIAEALVHVGVKDVDGIMDEAEREMEQMEQIKLSLGGSISLENNEEVVLGPHTAALKAEPLSDHVDDHSDSHADDHSGSHADDHSGSHSGSHSGGGWSR